MQLHHLTLSTHGRLPLHASEGEVLQLLSVLLRVGRNRVVAFSVVDNHIHLLVLGSDPGVLGRSLRLALNAAFASRGWESARIRPVESAQHLSRVVPYLLRQATKHGVAAADASWPGSCFPDLIGARLLADFDRALLARAAPRLRQRDLYRAVGLSERRLVPADDAAFCRLGPPELILAAARVKGLVDLSGKRSVVIRAKALAITASRIAGHKSCHTASLLGLSPRSAQRLAGRTSPQELYALRLRLSLDARVAESRRSVL